MSLWGKNDNKTSNGTVTLNHANRTVIGSGTSFGVTGHGEVGDIIRFGQPLGGPDSYFGEAVIIGVGSTLLATIDSTAGTTPDDITGVNYQITQSPKSSVTDAAFNKFSRGSAQKGSSRLVTTINGDVAVGATEITTTAATTGAGIIAGDVVKITHGEFNPRHQFSRVHSVATNTVFVTNGLKSTENVFRTDGAAYTGVSTVILKEAIVLDILDGDSAAGAHLDNISKGDTFTIGTNSIGIGTVTFNEDIGGERTANVTLNSVLTQAIPETTGGAKVVLKRGALSGSTIEIRGKEANTDETQVLGVSGAGVTAASQTAFETGAGWVGVTTYNQDNGDGTFTLRVKKEILVAMSGIATGNLPIYDGDPFA